MRKFTVRALVLDAEILPLLMLALSAKPEEVLSTAVSTAPSHGSILELGTYYEFPN